MARENKIAELLFDIPKLRDRVIEILKQGKYNTNTLSKEIGISDMSLRYFVMASRPPTVPTLGKINSYLEKK